MKSLNYTINLPKNFKIIVWKKSKNKIGNNKIFVFNNNKIFKFVFSEKFYLDKWSNTICFLKNYNKFNNQKIQNNVNNFFKSLNMYYFSKIKFKGKGFRIKFFKKIKLIKFYFGKSHKTFILLKKIKRKKISKYKFIIFGINKNKIINISKLITNIKKLNFYTLRGLKNSRQIIYKRKGKKGTYI